VLLYTPYVLKMHLQTLKYNLANHLYLLIYYSHVANIGMSGHEEIISIQKLIASSSHHLPTRTHHPAGTSTTNQSDW